jgi:nucleoside-diphosphate-sugar epimerase
MISINDLVKLVARIAKKQIKINNVPGPVGVMGRNSDNTLINKVLNWQPDEDLEYGLTRTFEWIKTQWHLKK